MEEVNTPAGTFHALKIEIDDSFRGGATRTTAFYSAQTRGIVKSNSEVIGNGLAVNGTLDEGAKTTFELIKFGTGE
jgi:hypothetical protein